MTTLEIDQPSDEQRWSCLQRSIGFDEPAGRWDKLMSQLSRHVKLTGGKDVNRLPLASQFDLFSQVFGMNGGRSLSDARQESIRSAVSEDDEYWLSGLARNKGNTLLQAGFKARYFNLLMALEDLERFSSASFDTWFYAAPEEEFLISPGVEELKSELSLTESQSAWLERALLACPAWDMLSHRGPWSGEPVCQFVLDVLEGVPDRAVTSDEFHAVQAGFHEKLHEWRMKLPAAVAPQAVVLVEGPTEAVLIPKFAALTGRALQELGVVVAACGGAKQVVRRYIALSDSVSIPIFVVIDSDATAEMKSLKHILREGDCLHVWAQGEVEDLLSRSLFLRLVNQYLGHLGAPCFVANTDLPGSERRTLVMNRLWRERGLGDFDKVGFAEFVADRLGRADVPAEVEQVIGRIHQMALR